MKRLISTLFSILLILLTSCEKQISSGKEEFKSLETRNNNSKIDVCHKAGNGTWNTININIYALQAHLAHGDIVPDEDGDGYTKENYCGSGDQNDCNDNNASINAGMIEICDNTIDDNCNGQIDENCCTNSVIICDQEWMKKNLDVSTYRDGTPIPEVQNISAWANLTTGAWCYYQNNSVNGPIYGKLYNWYAVADPRGLAPEGWHIPSDEEWNALQTCLGGELVAGGAMKETGTLHWISPNTEATNSSCFTGLPGGGRVNQGTFDDIGYVGIWWSTLERHGLAFHRNLLYFSGEFTRGGTGKICGFSVRCIKD